MFRVDFVHEFLSLKFEHEDLPNPDDELELMKGKGGIGLDEFFVMSDELAVRLGVFF